MDEAELKRQRWLKIIVIGLGLLILLLLGAVITTILIRGKKAASTTAVATTAVPVVAKSGGLSSYYGDIRVALPEGAKVEEMKADDGKLFLRASLPSGGAKVFVFDPVTGRALGSFEFLPR